MAPAAQRRDLMRLRTGNDAHLTYCTNIHPGESWEEVRAALGAHVPEVKKKICPDEPFGVGLRLSGLAISQLSNPVARAELRELLEQNNLYVFTVNGFPHGNFHNTPVKEQVYRPDWSEEERLVYTDGIADLLSHITPEDADYSPSISTVPVGFRPRMNTNEAQEHAANRILRQAVRLDSIRRQSGKTITLALEPEPHCALETSSEAVAFFEDFLLSTSALNAIPELRDRPDEAELIVRRHVGLCLDTCHAAVEFEQPRESLERIERAGITIFKVQLTTGLRVERLDSETLKELEGFVDEVYLHQVVERDGDRLNRYLDLGPALAGALARGGNTREWRVHFHVPVFLDRLGRFTNTQKQLTEYIDAWNEKPFTHHLEVETYTWDVLPPEYRDRPVAQAIAGEIEWVREHLRG